MLFENWFYNSSCQSASASSAAAAFMRNFSYAADCRKDSLSSLDAGLLASVLFVLIVLGVLGFGAVLALIAVSILRIIIAAVQARRPKSWELCFC